MVKLALHPGFLVMWSHRICLVIGGGHCLNKVAGCVQQTDETIGWIPLLSRFVIWAPWLARVVGWVLWLG